MSLYNNIFDAHAHYDDKWFDDDRFELLENIHTKGVCGIVNNAVDLETAKTCIEYAEKYDFMYAAVGFHPENLENIPDNYLEQLAQLSKHKKVVAIGETGLDEKEIEELNSIIKNNEGESEETKALREELEGVAQIGIDDFAKVDLRVCEVKTCEPVKKSKKLLQCTIFDGVKDRTVVSGIANYYKPEELIGKKIILVQNLKPAKLCGVESCGMILSAVHGDDLKVVFVDNMPVGSKIC